MEKSVYVREMFASIAPRYDATNRLLTGGVDERWRRRAGARTLAAAPGRDLGYVLRHGRSLVSPAAHGSEPVRGRGRFLRAYAAWRARACATRSSRLGTLRRSRRDGAPVCRSFVRWRDHGFSMRNVVDIVATIREARRVLKPGARFVNLDVSKAPNPLFKRAFDVYFYGLVPLIGGLVGGSKSALSLSAELAHELPERR